ncbi:MAG: hypothetical protein IJY00_04055 [Bacteroidaceae bacterium]|nr:hypothetical protein [Bacteroidaceae bacterium]
MRKITFLISLLVSVWATAQTSLPQPSTDGDPHYYKFLNVVDSDMRITTNGYGFQTTREEASTLFTFEAVDGEEGVYYIKSATYDAYVSANNVEEGQNLRWTTDKTNDEKWMLKQNGNSIAVVTYATKGADVAEQLAWAPSNNTITNASNIVLKKGCDATANQASFWTLAKKNPPAVPTFIPVPLEEITDGWYQIKVVSGKTNTREDKAAGRYVTNTPAYFGGYKWIFSLRAQNVVSSTFVYVEKNQETGKYTIKTCKGEYSAINALISQDPAPLNFSVDAGGDNTQIYIRNDRQQIMGFYDENSVTGAKSLFIGASTGNFPGKTFQFSKVDNYIAEHYNVYNIRYDDFEPIRGRVGVTYHAEDYNGVRLAYPGGAYFVRKDRGPAQAANFDITSSRNVNFLYLDVDQENRDVIVGQNLTTTVEEILRVSENPNQVGFPENIAEYNTDLRTALEQAEGLKNITNLTALNTAFEAWKTSLNSSSIPVVMPKDGKAYYLVNVQQNLRNTRLLANDENGNLIANTYHVEGSKDLNATFVCHKMDDGRYVFTNAAKGNYLIYKGVSAGAPDGYNDNKGYHETYLANKCAFNVISQPSGRPGTFRLVSERKNNGTVGAITLNADGTWNANSNGAAFRPDCSNAFLLEEATDYNMNNVTLQTPTTTDGYNYASLDLPYATTIPTGVEAFSATLSDDKQFLNLAAIEGTTLPKNTAVVLRSASKTAATFVPATEPGTAVTDNDLAGTVDATAATPTGSTFVLSGAFGKIGFYKYTAATLPAGKAYLESADSAVQGLLFGDGNVTGIEAVETGNDDNAAYYDLSGRRVEHPATGIYVRGGKKVFVK